MKHRVRSVSGFFLLLKGSDSVRFRLIFIQLPLFHSTLLGFIYTFFGCMEQNWKWITIRNDRKRINERILFWREVSIIFMSYLFIINEC